MSEPKPKYYSLYMDGGGIYIVGLNGKEVKWAEIAESNADIRIAFTDGSIMTVKPYLRGDEGGDLSARLGVVVKDKDDKRVFRIV